MNEFSGAEALAVLAIMIGMASILTGPIGRAIGDRLRRTPPPARDPALEAEVDTLRSRVAEVEERLDFAERLLASARQADQLPGGANR